MPTLTSDEVGLTLEVGGIAATVVIKSADVPIITRWSTSEVIMYLGQDGPAIQRGLRELFGS